MIKSFTENLKTFNYLKKVIKNIMSTKVKDWKCQLSKIEIS